MRNFDQTKCLRKLVVNGTKRQPFFCLSLSLSGLLPMKIINALKAENNIINTKLHRVEGENVLKVRDIIYHQMVMVITIFLILVTNQ